jgi:hypothetical protein
MEIRTGIRKKYKAEKRYIRIKQTNPETIDSRSDELITIRFPYNDTGVTTMEFKKIAGNSQACGEIGHSQLAENPKILQAPPISSPHRHLPISIGHHR